MNIIIYNISHKYIFPVTADLDQKMVKISPNFCVGWKNWRFSTITPATQAFLRWWLRFVGGDFYFMALKKVMMKWSGDLISSRTTLWPQVRVRLFLLAWTQARYLLCTGPNYQKVPTVLVALKKACKSNFHKCKTDKKTTKNESILVPA